MRGSHGPDGPAAGLIEVYALVATASAGRSQFLELVLNRGRGQTRGQGTAVESPYTEPSAGKAPDRGLGNDPA